MPQARSVDRESANSRAPAATPPAPTQSLVARYEQVRRFTEQLCTPLVPEDHVVQSMPDVSPTKWHLAHTSWFFETFILSPHLAGYTPYDPHYSYLFNSYYVSVGDRHCRQNRGLLSRPTVADVYSFRGHVDRHMRQWLTQLGDDGPKLQQVTPLVELGLHHEQQHQELLLTDIKHVFWVNPLRPAYQPLPERAALATPSLRWVALPEGLYWIGHDGQGFSFDNETPRHRTFVDEFQLGSRLITNGEYKQFMADGGYERPSLWLSAGWAAVQEHEWRAPLYWLEQDGLWLHHTMGGVRLVADDEPIGHVSYFEADAFARWAGSRLPTEAEWEVAGTSLSVEGHFAESGLFHPQPAIGETPLEQMYGNVWEWTGSQYTAYPGFKPAAGAIGEYNGKFMCNQFVLRGGSCATSQSHIRPTYRNFFPPEARWQFTGFRLARDV